MNAIQKVFYNIPKVKSVQEKINNLVQRHENNYFIDQELNTIDRSLSVLVILIVKVTKKNLIQTVTYDMQAKIKKIHWVLKSEEEFASKIKRKHENGLYSSFKDIYEESADIYEKY